MYAAWFAVAYLNLIFVGLHGFVEGSGGHSPNGIPNGERPQMDKESKRLSTDDIRCFCNLPQCVSTNYMCRPSKIVGGKQNGCFSEVREPTDKSPTRHGCVDLLDNLDQPMKCDNSPRDHSSSSGTKASSGHASYTEMLLLCCYEDLCNHDDNLESQKIKSDIVENTDLLSPGRFSTYDETDPRLNVPMLPSPGLSNNDDWFRVATIAVPICGAVILFSLIAVAIKILRSERIALTSSKLDSPSELSRKFPIDHEAQITKTSPHLSRYSTNNYLSDCDKKNESRAKLNQLINLEYSLLPQSCNDNIKPNNTEPCGSNNFNRNVNITLDTSNINTKDSLDKVYEKETLNSKTSNWSGSNTYKSYDI